MFRNLLFYKYVRISDPEGFRDDHRVLCKSLGLLGKIIVSGEGINGSVSGSVEDTQTYMDTLRADDRFSDIDFKEGFADAHTFNKMIVRVRPQIVTFGVDVDISKKADYIEPEELKQLIDSGDVILLDARNKYEAQVGTFKDAIVPDINVFKDFHNWVDDNMHLKDKPIVTFCTGGIRCEKASAYLKEKGFTNVKQLHGGIITYGKKCGSAHWDGSCFVFDQRHAIPLDDCGCLQSLSDVPSDDEPVAFKRALGFK